MPDPLFSLAIRRFDEANAQDPNQEMADGLAQPRELVYARRLFQWVLKLSPQASPTLLLAARCQHICRWKIPRDKYEMTKAGYLRWRSDLKRFHADTAGQILRDAGYDEATIAAVQALNLKKNFPADPECQVLEDALCLIFLEHQFADLASRTAEDKMLNAVRKTWGKMSPQAREIALALPLNEAEKALLQKALTTSKVGPVSSDPSI